jgi:hypothetical protein
VRRFGITTIGFAVVVACALLRPGVAAARSQRNLEYRPDLAWTAAIRLLRVDLGFEIVERDPDARFVIFRYVDGNQSHPGTLEIAERPLEDGRTAVRVIVSVPALPSYVELNLIDRLERKLVEEIGVAPPPPRPSRARAQEREQEERASRREEEREDSREGSEDEAEEGEREGRGEGDDED